MFREMRRSRQALSPEECTAILEKGTSGVLALAGDSGYPYAVPMSYVFHKGFIYMHSAGEGHKIDAIRREKKASFCVIGQDQVVPEQYTSYFRSVIVFGTVRILEDPREKREALEALALKYAPNDSSENRNKAMEGSGTSVCMLEFSIEHMAGKEAIELVRRKKAGC